MNLAGLISLVALWFYFSPWYLLLIWFFWFWFGCIGVEIGLHRLYSHNAFKLDGPWRYLVGWCSIMGAQGSPIWWASHHRALHHPYADKERDLHSPLHGIWHAFMGWQFSQKTYNFKQTIIKDLLKDRLQQYLHRNCIKIFWITHLILCLLLGWQLWLCCIVPAVLLAMHQENIVNVVCHLDCFGYRNFETNDHSRNILLLGWLFWGQGFHNNHHALAKEYNFGQHWFEFDLCRLIVPALIKIDIITKKIFMP